MDEAGRVRVQIDPACTELIADLEQVLRDGQKIKKTTRRSDPYFRRTHVSGALGYWLAFDAPTIAASAAMRPRIPRIPTPAYASTQGERGGFAGCPPLT